MMVMVMVMMMMMIYIQTAARSAVYRYNSAC